MHALLSRLAVSCEVRERSGLACPPFGVSDWRYRLASLEPESFRSLALRLSRRFPLWVRWLTLLGGGIVACRCLAESL